MTARIEPGRFLTAPVGTELFVLDQRSGQTFRLGGSGGRFWGLFEQGLSSEEAAAVVAADAGVPVEAVKVDAARFEAELVELGLLSGDG